MAPVTQPDSPVEVTQVTFPPEPAVGLIPARIQTTNHLHVLVEIQTAKIPR